MSVKRISRDNCNQFSSFSKDFRTQALLSDFLQKPFTAVGDLIHQAALKAPRFSKEARINLVETLRNQIGNFASESQLRYLEQLKSDSCFTITTGHQLTLFGGPLYLIYKVLHVVKLTQLFNDSQSTFSAVPVFWMASEDHDFEEVKSTHLFMQKVSYSSEQSGAVGRFFMSDFSEVHKQFASFFEGKSAEINALLEIPFQTTYAEYLQEFLSKLFADFGVLVLNPDCKTLKKEFIPVFKRELNAPVSFNAVQRTNLMLEAKGYTPQAMARSCNLFYLSDQKRIRIERTDNQFSISDKIVTQEELFQLVEREPENFSPNVILRPVYQETILPNLMYVGGGGEMAYWTQLKGVFEAHETIYPLLCQRVSVQLIDQSMQKRLEKLNWSSELFFTDKETLKKSFLSENQSEEIDFSTVGIALLELKNTLLEKTKSIDEAMLSATEAEMARISKQVESLQHRLVKQLKQRHENTLSSIDFISERILPAGTLQERYFHWLQFAPSGNYSDLLNQIYAAIDPMDTELIEISL